MFTTFVIPGIIYVLYVAVSSNPEPLANEDPDNYMPGTSIPKYDVYTQRDQ